MTVSLQEAINGWITTIGAAVGVFMAVWVPVQGWRKEKRLHAIQADAAAAEKYAARGAADAVVAEMAAEGIPPPSQEIVDALERLLDSGDTHAEAEAEHLAAQAAVSRELLDQIAALRRAIEDLTAYLKRLLG